MLNIHSTIYGYCFPQGFSHLLVAAPFLCSRHQKVRPKCDYNTKQEKSIIFPNIIIATNMLHNFAAVTIMLTLYKAKGICGHNYCVIIRLVTWFDST